MKQTLLLVFLFAGAFSIRVKAETEPNDTKSQANVLPLKGSISGGIYPSTDADWFSVTTTSDGKLSFSITSTNGKNVRVILYDHDGITQLNGTVTAASASFTNDGLAKGTYYLLVTTYYGGETPGYSISNTFVYPDNLV